MNKKSILMPHACQKIGWWLLLLIPLMQGFYRVLYYFFHETKLFATVNDNSRFITMLSGLVVVASAFLICLSKEKVEDEMISQYRLRAVGVAAFAGFVIILAFWVFMMLDHGFRFFVGNAYSITVSAVHVFLPFVVAAIYYIVFKILLLKSRK